MSLKPEESKALLALPEALEKLTALLQEHAQVVKRAARRQVRAQRRYLTATQVAHELGFRKGCSVWQMPEVLAERIYPTVSATPRWTREGLDRATANMPRQPRSPGKRGERRAA